MAKFNKFSSMNIFDFLLTNYGSVEKIFIFMKEAGYTSYDDFVADSRKTLDINPQPNEVTTFYANKGIVVSSVSPSDYIVSIAYNNDLTPKTELIGDFNNDFNNDFNTTNLVSSIVGYSGMDLYITFSFTNSGSLPYTVNGTATLTGETTQNYSKLVGSNSTETITVVFPAVSVGVKTLTLTGDATDALVVEVLDAPNFEYNLDLTIDTALPVVSGDTVTVSYSITNNGSNTGTYNTSLFIEQVGVGITQENYLLSIDSLATETITYSFVVATGEYVIRNLEGTLINLTVG